MISLDLLIKVYSNKEILNSELRQFSAIPELLLKHLRFDLITRLQALEPNILFANIDYFLLDSHIISDDELKNVSLLESILYYAIYYGNVNIVDQFASYLNILKKPHFLNLLLETNVKSNEEILKTFRHKLNQEYHQDLERLLDDDSDDEYYSDSSSTGKTYSNSELSDFIFDANLIFNFAKDSKHLNHIQTAVQRKFTNLQMLIDHIDAFYAFYSTLESSFEHLLKDLLGESIDIQLMQETPITNIFFKNEIDFYYHQPFGANFLTFGKFNRVIAVNHHYRNTFMEEHPLIARLLKRNLGSPLIEEGHAITPIIRERIGEHYLDFTLISLMLMMQLKNTSHDDKIDLIRVFNDQDDCLSYIKNFSKTDLAYSAFIYIKAQHAIPFYLQQEKDSITIYIIDSMPGPAICYQQLIFNDSINYSKPINVYINQTKLQKDFFSCGLFAIKTMLGFFKYDIEDIFQQIINHAKPVCGIDNINCHMIERNFVPLWLLKYSQMQLTHKSAMSAFETDSCITLSENTFTKIVSNKRNLSLQNYLNHYSFFGHNTAMLEKKYYWLDRLESYLKELKISINDITPHDNFNLPPVIDEICNFFRKSDTSENINSLISSLG